MIYYDFHCDTLYEMEKRGLPYEQERLHIGPSKSRVFDEYGQVFAAWSDHKKSDGACMEAFRRMRSLFEEQIAPRASDTFRPFLAVEDARLLEGRIERLEELYDSGVRLMTMTWQGESCIGGAFDTEIGLTDFGKEAVRQMIRLGMVPDISHASDKTAGEILDIAEREGGIAVATHSNARSVFAHPRNLTDDLFRRVLAVGGMVGISLAPQHLAEDADIGSVLRHLEHDLSLGGEDALCLGCDLDGVERLPRGIASVADVKTLIEAMPFGESVKKKIAGENLKRFLLSIYNDGSKYDCT